MIPLATLYSSLNLDDSSNSIFDFENSIFSQIPGIEILQPTHELTEPIYETIKEKSRSGLGLLILTGGIESLAAKMISLTDGPILILVNSRNNSLAAGLEIYGTYRSSRNIHLLTYEDYPEKVKNKFRLLNVYNKINTLRFLEIGEPSPWLLTSKDVKSFGPFKSEIKEVEVSEINKFKSEIGNSELKNTVNRFSKNFDNENSSEKEIEKSAEVYLSLKSIIEKEKADCISVRCFDLLEDEVTACLALSVLNDEGVVAGCEGDLQALLTLVFVKELFNTTGWMANPSALNFEENTFKLAHCTVPSDLLEEKGKLDTHFESGKSLGVKGRMKIGKITLARIGGNFDKIQIAEGAIVENDKFSNELCRTQVTIKLNKNLSDWLDSALGNHQVMFYGHHSEAVKEFAQLTGLEIV